MGKKLLTTLLGLLLIAVSASAEKVDLGTIGQDVNVTVLESNDSKITVRFDIGHFEQQAIEIEGANYFKINCGGEGNLLNKGEPSLPRLCRSVILPDDARMDIRVIASEYIDFPETMVAPSKGNLPRTINPDDVPYEFGKVYQSGEWSPGNLADFREPFIQRDYRGTVIELNAFQYNPARRTLRVYHSVTVELTNAGPGEVNVLHRDKSEIRLVSDFELMYQRRFINYDQVLGKYPSVGEVGDMLIITHDAFNANIMDLADWKLQKGIKTTVVNVSSIGNNSSSIYNFIDQYYDTTNLCYVLLVGDGSQVATAYSGGDSDPYYSKLEGSDDWPEIFVGRFSANNLTELQTQIDRSIYYEKTPYGTDWYQKAMGVASNQGPGDDNEYDNVHMDNIRGDLLAYGFTEVDQIYDPSATSTMVSNALNNGRSLANYTGHGSMTAWSSSGFSNSNVNNLTNDWMLPMIVSVACVNGDFDGSTCFAEAWLRATNGSTGAPTGAIAAYMSTINQSWDPPMEGQDEVNILLVNEAKTTIGGLLFNGSCSMMEEYGSGGVDMFDTWLIFGDPSIPIRIKNPETMTVNHTAAHIFTLAEYDVDVPGMEGALCALYHNGTLFGSGFTNASGQATISIVGDLPIGESVTLTVTGFHKTPYIGSVQVIAPEGPFVIYDSYSIDDVMGNNDGVVNCGESINMTVAVQNVGPDTAFNVSASLATDDIYVTLIDDNEVFGLIPGNFGFREVTGAFAFDVSEDMPNDHVIEFSLAITGADQRDTTWVSNFTVTGQCYPAMTADPMTFTDSMYLDDWTIDTLVIYNDGHAPLDMDFSCSVGWLDFAGGMQTIPPHENMIFEVVVNSTTLSYGDHFCTLDFSCNDPAAANGSVDFIVHIFSPDIFMPETYVEQTVSVDGQSSAPFLISNNGPGRLEYNITRLMFNGKNGVVAKSNFTDPIGYHPADDKSQGSEPYFAPVNRGSGGPDSWGYNWADSDEAGGPAYEWVDISGVGTAVALVDDDTTTAITIGFSFPFYENYYSELYIGSNGIVTFGAPSRNRTNQVMPNAQTPNNMIAMWWDDLDPEEAGAVYYYHDAANDRFIVSFDGVPNYKSPDGTGALWFQAILYATGQIKLQYGTMDPGEDYSGLTGATIGIEDGAGTDGLTVAYNAEYMHDNLAVLFTAAQWLSISPGSGFVDPFTTDTVTVSFDAASMAEGTYNGQLQINSNDPDLPYQEVPVTMNVSSAWPCGDITGDQIINILDVTYMIEYLYNDGLPPVDMAAADVNNDGDVNILDITAIVAYLYEGGIIDCGY